MLDSITPMKSVADILASPPVKAARSASLRLIKT
jgi:hypothetical protein